MSLVDTVLVTGGAIGDIPTISELKKMGYRVITSGNRPNDFGHRLSHEYIEGDYTNVDQMLNISIKNSVVGIVSSCHDLAYIVAAEVASKMDLPGYDRPSVARTIHTKSLLRKSLHQCDIRTPKYFSCRSTYELQMNIASLTYPVIVKPTDLTGGNGISVANNELELLKAYEYAFTLSISKEVVVEEYLKGTYHGCTAIIENKKVVFIFFDNEHFHYDRYRVSATSYPSKLSDSAKSEIREALELFAFKMSLVDGLIHLQIIQTDKGPVILEICRRMPGDLYPFFVEFAIPFRYTHHVISKFLGKSLTSTFTETKQRSRYYLRSILMGDKAGVFQNYSQGPKFSSSLDFEFFKKGDEILNPKITTLAIYFSDFSNYSECIKYADSFPEVFKPNID